MVAQHVAVIRCEANRGFVEQALLAQSADHDSELVIDMRAECVKSPQCIEYVMRLHVRAPTANGLEQVRQVPTTPCSVARGEQFLVRVHPQVRVERDKGRVRMPVRKEPERGLGGIPSLDRTNHLVRRPVRHVQVFRQMPRPRRVIVVAHAVVELAARVAPLGKERFVVVHDAVLGPALFVQHHVVESDSVALRVNMQLADRVSLVAAVAKRLSHGRQVRHRLSLAEIAVAVGARAGSGHEGATRRYADRAFGVGVPEQNAATD